MPLWATVRFVAGRMNANEATLVWVDEYSRMADAYDKNVAPRFEPIAQEVVRLAAPKPNELFFDGVMSNLGVPALGYDRVFQEVHRVLKPGGRFVFSEWPTEPNPTFAAVRELLGTHGTMTPSKDLAQVREAVRLVRTDPEAKALGDPEAVFKALDVADFDHRVVVKKEFPVRF